MIQINHTRYEALVQKDQTYLTNFTCLLRKWHYHADAINSECALGKLVGHLHRLVRSLTYY